MKPTDPQQPPKPGSASPTVDLVLADLAERKAYGTAKYGVAHQSDNGRDHLVDLYQELLDGCVYVRAEIERRKVDTRFAEWVNSGDCGLSSRCIAAVMQNLRGSGEYPQDASDFGRCHRLLNRFPEWRGRIREMGAVHPGVWAELASRWQMMTDYFTRGQTSDVTSIIRQCERVAAKAQP